METQINKLEMEATMANLKKFKKTSFNVDVADFTFATEIWEWLNFSTIYSRDLCTTEADVKARNQLRDDIYNSMINAYPNLKNYDTGGNDFKGVWAEEVSHIFTHGDAQCVACNSRIKYKMPFHNTGNNDFPEFVLVGQDCAYILDQETDFEALAIRQKEAEELAKQKAEFEKAINDFKTNNPALYQIAEYFAQDLNNHIIVDIFSKIKWGLSEKQIAFLEKLCLKAWEYEVNKYWQLMTKVEPLTAGMQTIPVRITRYYYNDNGFAKTLFHTEGNSKIFTGKTQQLAMSKIVDYNSYYRHELDELWSVDKPKKERKQNFVFDYYPQNTTGLLTIDLTVADNDDTVGFGKIVGFTPTKLPNSYNDK